MYRKIESASKQQLLIFVMALCLVSLSCQVVQFTPLTEIANKSGEETAVSSSSTNHSAEQVELPPAGSSRANPYPPDTIVKLNDWEIELLETMRGDPAWQEIHLANPNNTPPPEGWEYLLVKMRFKNKSFSTDKQYIGAHVTGDGRIIHFSFNNGVVSPEPTLETDLSGRSESVGWEAYLVKEGEENLMLFLEDHENYDAPPVYLALEEGAAITIDRDTLLKIQPTDYGMTPEDPVPFGQTATGEDWQVIVLDVQKGDAAWQTLYETNKFNDPPPDGEEYILVKVRVRYIGLEDTEQYISDSAFALVSNTGREFEMPSLVEPEPEMYNQIYAGGEADGWLAFQVPVGAKNITLKFSPDYSGANDRYLNLGQGR